MRPSPPAGTSGAVGPAMLAPVAGLALACGFVVLLLARLGLSGLMLLHAGAMVTAWCLLLPAGALIARYFKVTRQQDFPAQLDNPFWWNWHRGLQYLGVALSTVGYGAMVGVVGFSLESLHSRIGLGVVVVGWLQVLSALLRGSKGGPTDAALRGDHYDMTPRRRVFEAFHKSAGWGALALGFLAAASGAEMAGFGMAYPVFGLLLAGVIAIAALFQRQGRRTPTYLALWGREGPE